MKRYPNRSGNAGIAAYESGPDYIRLQFRDSAEVYTYSYRSAGKANVEKLKQLAIEGQGLTTFVNRNVRHLFER